MEIVRAVPNKDGLSYRFMWDDKQFVLEGSSFWFHLKTEEDISKSKILKMIKDSFERNYYKTVWSSSMIKFERSEKDKINFWIEDLRFSLISGTLDISEILYILIGQHEIVLD